MPVAVDEVGHVAARDAGPGAGNPTSRRSASDSPPRARHRASNVPAGFGARLAKGCAGVARRRVSQAYLSLEGAVQKSGTVRAELGRAFQHCQWHVGQPDAANAHQIGQVQVTPEPGCLSGPGRRSRGRVSSMTAWQHSTRPCHQAAASPLTATPWRGPQRRGAHARAPVVKALSVARKTLGAPALQRPARTRLHTPRAPQPGPRRLVQLVTPSWRRRISSIRTAPPSAITPAPWPNADIPRLDRRNGESCGGGASGELRNDDHAGTTCVRVGLLILGGW